MRLSDQSEGDKRRVIIGTIVKAHGISGFVKVLPQTDMPGRFREKMVLTLQAPGERDKCLTVEEIRPQGEWLLILFEGVHSRTEAEHLRGGDLVIPMCEVGPLPEGNYYIFDIIGMTVVNERGEERGIVKDIYSGSSYDIYAVRWKDSEYLIPAVREFIREISLEHRVIHISEQEGLFDQNDADAGIIY